MVRTRDDVSRRIELGTKSKSDIFHPFTLEYNHPLTMRDSIDSIGIIGNKDGNSYPLIQFGISLGLDEYYEHCLGAKRQSIHKFKDSQIEKNIQASHNKIIISQVQPTSLYKGEMRVKYSTFRKKGIRAICSLFQEESIYMMSANMCAASFPEVRIKRTSQKAMVASDEALRANYDFLARKCGFKFDEKTQLYLRKAQQ